VTPTPTPPFTLVLASTSVYRRMLLARLQLTFQIIAPEVDESAHPGETPLATALRLAAAKARRVAALYQNALIIGSDQVCALGGEVLNKPGNHANAVAQLRKLSGNEALFHTALALLNTQTGRLQQAHDTTKVRFRVLTEAQIEAYLLRDKPYNSAGSAKAETLGIALVESITADDPTAIIGLPLIKLVSLLKAEGVEVV
jgi:septum formation protein